MVKPRNETVWYRSYVVAYGHTADSVRIDTGTSCDPATCAKVSSAPGRSTESIGISVKTLLSPSSDDQLSSGSGLGSASRLNGDSPIPAHLKEKIQKLAHGEAAGNKKPSSLIPRATAVQKASQLPRVPRSDGGRNYKKRQQRHPQTIVDGFRIIASKDNNWAESCGSEPMIIDDGFQIIDSNNEWALNKWAKHSIAKSIRQTMPSNRAPQPRVRFTLKTNSAPAPAHADPEAPRASLVATAPPAPTHDQIPCPPPSATPFSRRRRRSRYKFPSYPSSSPTDSEINVLHLFQSQLQAEIDWHMKTMQLMETTKLPFATVWESMLRGRFSGRYVSSCGGSPSPTTSFGVNEFVPKEVVQVLDKGKWWDAIVLEKLRKTTSSGKESPKTFYYDVMAAKTTRNGFLWTLHGVHPAAMRRKNRFPRKLGTGEVHRIGNTIARARLSSRMDFSRNGLPCKKKPKYTAAPAAEEMRSAAPFSFWAWRKR
jgi:hypothetical protein